MVVKSDGSIWFTDPTYGIDADYEGHKAESEIGRSNVYRVDPQSGAITRGDHRHGASPTASPSRPTRASSTSPIPGRTHGPDNPAHIRVFNVKGKKVSGGKVFAELHGRAVRRLPAR